jgi:hypothetical protein
MRFRKTATDMTRRQLIAGSLASAGLAAQAARAQVGAPPAVEAWYDGTMRWMQLILVESDPAEIDTDWWIDLFRRTHTTGVCLNAGGVCAFYPTQIPYHHKSAFLKGAADDPLGRLVAGCRKLGMAIVARTDSHSCLEDAAAAHPEWLNIDENGKPRRHMTMPETRLITCALGPYNFDFMTRVHRELVTNYGFDGLFCNRWQTWARGMCYCETCQRLFRAYSGMDLPRGANPADPAAARYTEWMDARHEELWRFWDSECQKINPRFRYFTNVGLPLAKMNELAPTAIVEEQSRGARPLWAMGVSGKRRRAAFGKKPLMGMFGVTSGPRQSVTREAEVRAWALDAIANGLRPWLLKTSGLVPDKRWVPAVEKVYDWHWRNEKYMRNVESLARVAVVVEAGGGPGAGEGQRVGAPVADSKASLGMYQALIEGRIPFELVDSNRMSDTSSVDRFKLLILPDLAALSDGQCEQLRAFVGRGGSLLATFQTSLYSGATLRSNFGLADLFGVECAGLAESNGDNSYMRVEAATKHPILSGLEQTGQILNTGRHVAVRAVASFPSPPLTRIPTFPTLPMEEIYPRTKKTDIPEVYLRAVGQRSRIVYFPCDIDATFATSMEPDHALVIRNAVNWAMNEEQPVTVSGSGVLDATCWRQADSMTVHMVNMTNPFMLRSAYREAIPVGAQRVSVRVPPGATVRGVRLLVSNQTPLYTQSAGRVNLTVPSVVDNEVVAIDL